MKHIHPVFNVVKLTSAPPDPIIGRHISPPPLPEIIDGEEEWVIEEILDAKVINWKLWYLVKWKDFGIEHNTWEPWDNIHAPNLVADFYQKHPGAPRHISATEFCSIQFEPLLTLTVPGHHFSKEGGGGYESQICHYLNHDEKCQQFDLATAIHEARFIFISLGQVIPMTVISSMTLMNQTMTPYLPLIQPLAFLAIFNQPHSCQE